ncbi:MAG: radical SAM protein [Deltaproteobacteria bacterium]|nr:radical SAM protein [Deltaproteobacteria bacterium]
MPPQLILINPWIHDFAAYDLWSKPLGLLILASRLRHSGFRIRLIDCLDVHHPGMDGDPNQTRPVRRLYGTGKFWRERVPKPALLKDIPRPYSRYGISRQLFRKDMEEVKAPTAILVTSLMTYWYPGVQEAVRLCREAHPGVPVILGGIYARLCRDHAIRYAGADHVITESVPEAAESLLGILAGCGVGPDRKGLPARGKTPYPALDLLYGIDYVPLLTSTGCPYRCTYCASRFLNPRPERRDPYDVLEEILFWHERFGVRDFAFYDDALLADAPTHLSALLEALVRRRLKLRFHTPNALHVRGITPETARLLFQAGFRTIRLGLETSDMELQHETGGKVAEGEFERAVENLLRVGYGKSEIGAYVLMGLPGQSAESVRATLEFVDRTGASPYLAEYSPIPHTPLWEKAIARSTYDLASEPLFHNNTLMPCWDEENRSRVQELKGLAKTMRR